MFRNESQTHFEDDCRPDELLLLVVVVVAVHLILAASSIPQSDHVLVAVVLESCVLALHPVPYLLASPAIDFPIVVFLDAFPIHENSFYVTEKKLDCSFLPFQKK